MTTLDDLIAQQSPEVQRAAQEKYIQLLVDSGSLKLIFLDIDGVLNTHNFNTPAGSNLIESRHIQRLNRVLLATDAKIVLSSAWRYIIHRGESNLTGMDWLLRSHGLIAKRLISITEPDTMVVDPRYDGITHKTWPVPNERGSQIQNWLNRYVSSDSSYIVIDDGGYDSNGVWTDLGITANGHLTVWTHPKKGLTEENADLAIALLCGKTNNFPESPVKGTTVDRQ